MAERHRLLRFALGGAEYAIRVEAVSGLVDCGPLREVPGAPRAVVGLAEWRGNILTVLDLPYLLGQPREAMTPCLVCLSAPLQHVALLLTARVRMAEFRGTIDADREAVERFASRRYEGRFEHGGAIVRLIEPQAIVRSAGHDALRSS